MEGQSQSATALHLHPLSCATVSDTYRATSATRVTISIAEPQHRIFRAMRGWVWPTCTIRRAEVRTKRCFGTSRAHLKRVNVAQLLAQDAEAKDVDVYGWVRSLRKQKKIAFAALGDGSTLESVQAVLKPDDAAQ